VQAARGLVDLGIEFAARVQGAHDHFEGGLLRKFRVRIDRNAAAVIADREISVGRQLDFDEGCVTGKRLIHRVVDDLGEQVMQRPLIGAADVHSGPAANRLEAFQYLDVAGRVAGLGAAGALGPAARGCGPRFRHGRREQIVRWRFLLGFQWLGHISSRRLVARQRANH
jgi:hypothetical protein